MANHVSTRLHLHQVRTNDPPCLPPSLPSSLCAAKMWRDFIVSTCLSASFMG